MPCATKDEVVRGPRKSFMNQGFIRRDLEIYKSWSEMESMEFIGKIFEDNLSQIHKEPGKCRYKNIFSQLYCVRTVLKLIFSCLWLPDG